MKTNKVTKLGISLLSVAALGVVAPALIDTPIFGIAVVKAEERQGQIKIRIRYLDEHSREIAPMYTGVLNPGESVNIYKDIEGHQVVSNFSWMPGYDLTYNIASTYFYGANDGYLEGYLRYRKLDADVKPSEETKPDVKPSEQPKQEAKPEPNPSDTPKPEVKPETKPSETPKPEVKPEIKPSETPKPEVKPETKPSETPKPEVKPETKPSETPKPEVKPEPAPKDKEQQKPLKYRIDYFDADTGEEISREYGALNPGETINIHKNIDGYEVVSNYSWMPGYNVDYQIMSTYFGGTMDEHYMFLDYKKVNADAKPSETPKPEVKPEPKPSDTPKPEVKPAPKPSETPKPEVKPEPKPSETPKPEVKPETKPSETPKPEVKPETKPSETPKPEVKPEPKPSETPKPEVKPEPKPSETPKPEVKPVPKPSETPKPEVKPELKPSETPKPEVKPSEKPVAKPETNKPTTKPQTGLNNAPTAPINPVGQDSNTKADKPVSKTETTALPNTGEQNSILGFAGFLLASLGLAGLTYKGRH